MNRALTSTGQQGSRYGEHLRLAWDLARRDVLAPYRRSVIGAAVAVTPLCLLGIYWMIFGVIFGVQWQMPHAPQSAGVGFVLPFFIGLVLYLALADVVNSSSILFSAKRTYVVKSPFPIWCCGFPTFCGRPFTRR